jgi:hypothetical protein
MLISEYLKGDASFWAKYIKTIPTSFETTASWSDKELEQIEDPFLIQASQELRHGIEGDFENLFNLLDRRAILPDELDLHLFQWAWFAVGTRCFIVEGVSQYSLVPIADLLNHGTDSEVGWTTRREAYEMFIGNQQVVKGAQVFNNYGGDGA